MPTSDTIYGVRGIVTDSSDGSPITIHFPAGTVEGDYLLMNVCINTHTPDGNVAPTVTSGQGTRYNYNGASSGDFTRSESNISYFFDLDASDIALGYITIHDPGNTVPLPSGMLVIAMTLDNEVCSIYSSVGGFDNTVANPANQVVAFVSHMYTTAGNAPTNSDLMDVTSVVYGPGDGLTVATVGIFNSGWSSASDWVPGGSPVSGFTCRVWFNFFITPPPFKINDITPASVLVTPGTPLVAAILEPITDITPASVLVTPGETARVVVFDYFNIDDITPVSVLVTGGTDVDVEPVGNRGLLVEPIAASVLVTPSPSVEVDKIGTPFIITDNTPASVLVTPAESVSVTFSADEGTDMTLDFYGEVAAAAVRDLVISGRVVSGIGVRPLTGAVAVQTPVHYFV